jgi:hypothetical protein
VSGRLQAAAAVVAATAVTATVAGAARPGGPGRGPCAEPTSTRAYAQRVARALRAGRDVWGEALLAAPGGPTFEGARAYLNPLLFAGGPRRRPLTASGVYYLPFAQPLGAEGAESVALHVADGSEIVSERVGGRALTVGVGDRGLERYGSCLARLDTPRLFEGYLPVLETRYADAAGVRYRQQSFVARIPQTRSLVSFVRLQADTRGAPGASAEIRFSPSVPGLVAAGDRLVRGDAVYALFARGGRFDGTSVAYAVGPRSVRTVYAAWLVEPQAVGGLTLDESRFEAARRSAVDYWQRRLAEGAAFVVPEARVMNAQRSLLVQNLVMTWRYSIGNPYEEFSFPESVDLAQVIAAYSFGDVSRAILRTSLRRSPTPYPNWKMGEKLVGAALHYRLFGDRSFVEQVTPVLRGYVDALGRQITADRRGLLGRERFSSDIPDSVYGLHSQAVAWQGLRAMGHVWSRTGRPALGARCLALAARLEAGLREAVRVSARRLPDGSLFLPARLRDPEPAYGAVTASRSGSYWNLVMPYALASGLFAPGSAEARGALAYIERHGSRLLGLVRAAAFALYGEPVYPTSGTDQVYGINAARFLADNDQADQLVLSLYGHLAAGMTPGTFVSGEAASIAPLANRYYRSMYLPPNAASNAAFLETLRLMLVHETRGRDGEPNGLQLAYATPRGWLRPGGRMAVRRAPTAFGRVAFSIVAASRAVRAMVAVPARRPPRLALRLRLPRGSRVAAVRLNGRPFRRFDPGTATIDLSGRRGRIVLVAQVRR